MTLAKFLETAIALAERRHPHNDWDYYYNCMEKICAWEDWIART